ncbi:MAG: TolC family protein [Cryobacterium sp.]|nr:TolC family protein [Oligoflexia bacterium]
MNFRSLKSVLSILISGVFALNAAADVEKKSLTLQDLFQMAKAANPNVLKANSKIVEMADNGILARSNYFPSLTLQSTILSNQFLLSQKVWDGGATLSAYRQSKEEEKIAGWDKKSEIHRLYRLVTEAYYKALFEIQKMEILEGDAKLIDGALVYAEKQVKFGAIGRNILLKARVAHKKSESELFAARSEKEKATRVLMQLTRRGDLSLDALNGRLDPHDLAPLPETSGGEMVQTAAARSSDIGALKSREQAEISRNNYSLSEERPQVSLIVTYGVGEKNPPKSIYPGYQTGVNLGAFINIPLFSGFSSSAKNRISRERLVQINQDLNSTLSNIEFETNSLRDQLKQDANDVATLDSEVRFSERMWDEVNSEYQVGLGSPDLWFDATTNLEIWKIQQLEKTRDYMTKHAHLLAMIQDGVTE